jgi:hypothetical protein
MAGIDTRVPSGHLDDVGDSPIPSFHTLDG